MAKRPARLDRAVEKLQDTLGAMEMLFKQHGRVLQAFEQLQTQREECEKELKDSAKEVAEKDEGFRSLDGEGFWSDVTPIRTVNTAKLEKILGKKVTDVDGLADIKVTVKIDSVATLVRAKVLPPEAADAVEQKGFSIKVGYGERPKEKMAA